MKKLIVAVALSTITLNTQAFTVSNKALSEGYHILTGMNEHGLATGCYLEEGEFTFCNLGKVDFHRDVINPDMRTCEPFGPGNPENTCVGSDDIEFQVLINKKKSKIYEDVICSLNYHNQKDLDCWFTINNKTKSFTIKSKDQKDWIFSSVRSRTDEDKADYWFVPEE